MTGANQPAGKEFAGGSWHRVAGADEIPDGAVRMVRAGARLVALSHVDGRYGALDNACPHMGGPLGQGTIEGGRLACPWHGREYDPLTGDCEGFEEKAAAFPVEVRADGVYIRVEPGGDKE